MAVAKSLKSLRDQGMQPDVIYGHPGWGEMLYVRDVFPDAQIAGYCEFYFNRVGQGYGFDAEFAPIREDGFHVRTEDMTHAISLLASDPGISPTTWQQSRYSDELLSKIRTLGERGIRPALAQKLVGRCIFFQYLVHRGHVTAEELKARCGAGDLHKILRRT